MNQNLTYIISFFKKIGLAFIVYTFCRLLFYLFNLNQFQGGFPLDAFFYGLRFDFVAVSYLFLPFILLSILPLPFKENRYYKLTTKLFFHLGNTLGIVLNLIDVGYYAFSIRRSTADLFQFLSTGNDLGNMLPTYIKDYWFLFLILIGLIMCTEIAYRNLENKSITNPFTLKVFGIQSLFFIIVGSLTIIGFRGGVQLKPLDIINAASYTSPQHVSVLLNTPFCIIKTVLNDRIAELNYFEEDELAAIYSPEQTIAGNGGFESRNVVLIILESFAKEHVGFLNNGKGYTPFLDSLMQESYVFTNAYSSGSRSIESLPSIFSGIPPLMNTAYIISNYSENKMDALPAILKKKGYNTSFYHGGENGTMGFAGFTATAGIENYYGKDDYPLTNQEESSAWGIYDEPYLHYFANELNKKKEPFFSTLFTLSSHHPYKLPNQYISQFPEGELPIHKTIAYTDYSLKQFFENVKNTHWFKNTLFVFTADHSSEAFHPFYSTFVGQKAIPIFIYDPSSQLKGIDSNYIQHTDITPTLLNLLGINTSIVSFGKDVLSNKNNHLIGYTSNNFYYVEKEFVLLFDGEKATGFYNLLSDSTLQQNLITDSSIEIKKNEFEKKLKAILQQYTNRLINNQLSKESNKK